MEGRETNSSCYDSHLCEVSEEVAEEDLKEMPLPTERKSGKKERSNSWGEIDLDVDEIEPQPENRRWSRNASWDDLDLSEHLKLNQGSDEEAMSSSLSYIPNPDKIVLVGKLDDTFMPKGGDAPAQELLSPTRDENSKSNLKALSNRLGLMSPFKKKKPSAMISVS